MNSDINQDIAKELVAQTAGKTYDDVAHPSAHAVGQIVSFIPRTIRVWLCKWEKWILNGEYNLEATKQVLAEKLKNISEGKIIEPEPYVAVPALQQLSYSLDSEVLRELYANLLVSSMNIDTKEMVHPSFVDIIRQLLPDEARLLKTIYLNNEEDIIVENPNAESPIPKLVEFFENTNEISTSPIIQDNPKGYSFYLDNLRRLRLIETEPVFPENPYSKEASEKYSQIRLTEYGILFCDICIKEINE